MGGVERSIKINLSEILGCLVACVFPWWWRLEIALLFMGFSAAAQNLGLVGLSLRVGEPAGWGSACLSSHPPAPGRCHLGDQHSSVSVLTKGRLL